MAETNMERRQFIKLVALAGGTVLLASGAAGCGSSKESTPNTAQDSGELLATFALMSDIHISDGDEDKIGKFTNALADAAAYDTPPDAFLVAGDLSNYGESAEYEAFKQVIEDSPYSLDDFVFAIGNHDQYIEEADDADTLASQRERFVETFELPALSYDTYANDQHIIVLGPDNLEDGCLNFGFSEEQLDWLDNLLTDDDEQGVRSFVLTHEPLTNTVEGTTQGYWGYDHSVLNNEQVLDILNKHERTVFLSGHIHLTPSLYAVDALDGESVQGPLFVNDGSVGWGLKEYKDYDKGIFYSLSALMNVYENCLEFRFRNHTDQEWMGDPTYVYLA